MGRRYLSADYAAIVERVREILPGVAVHADAIVGFPTEDEAAWARTLAFVRERDFAGLHVFRYSARPGTAATRMRGGVDEPTKKCRAAELLAVAAGARARWAARQVGATAEVLFERRLADGRWIGHAADHTLVAASPFRGDDDLEHAIGLVAVDAVDPLVADRVVGRILALSRPLVQAPVPRGVLADGG
jgi:threonylcarbamoyladenosine tRNA methylthiotransferase MtaB